MTPSRNHILSRHRRWHRMLWCMIFTALFLSACGKKGPLYLPKDTAAESPGFQAVSLAPALYKKN
ncbi:MAG TPA: lipoprotein [Sulfuricaulis sp.]|nr:lipoprotein [Sulfuricaulis sp.]